MSSISASTGASRGVRKVFRDPDKPRPATVQTDQLPPYDESAEAGALACVLQTGDDRQLDELEPDYFYDPRCERVYGALKALADDLKPLDTVSLFQWLKDHGGLDLDVHREFVITLADQAPSPENFASYLDTLRDRSTRRAILRDTTELQRIAVNPAVPLESVSAIADKLLSLGNFRLPTIELLAAKECDPTAEPPPLQTVYSLAGITVCTPGNLTAITAGIKSGKTAVLGAMMAATCTEDPECDCLGFKSSNPDGLALLYFDFEQSPDDSWHCLNRVLKRSRLKQKPAWLHHFCLTGLGWLEAWEAVTKGIEHYADLHGGIHSALLDGAADLVNDVNVAGECNARVAELHNLAIGNKCPLVGVIHFNPGSDKSRGHLGSQLERKAESNLALEKDGEVTVIYSTKNRRAGIPKKSGPQFAFDTAKGMHVMVASRESAKEAAEVERLIDCAIDVFSERPSMRYTDVQTTLKTLMRVSRATAERKLTEMLKHSIITKSVAGLYTLNSK